MITTLFLDIGGVLLTNGWDRGMRKKAAELFSLNYEELDERHHLTFDTYEEGKLSLDDYLSRVVFYEKRNFSRNEFMDFMLKQSEPYPQMIDMFRKIKSLNRLKLVAVSNEGREINAHRVVTFKLTDLIDLFVISAFVHVRKPDTEIFRYALDLAQAEADKVLYIDDRPMFIEVAQTLGIRGINHRTFENTRSALEASKLKM